MSPRRLVVLVNGLPAAGKSTLAPKLARALGLPLLSKDVIKETHADVLGVASPDGRTQRQWNAALGRAASETMWSLLAYAPAGAVLESSWRADVRPLVQAGLTHAGVSCPVEVWCDVSPELAWSRYVARAKSSHPIHGALMSHGEEWARMVEHAQPLALGPVRRVDTSRDVDVDQLAAWCESSDQSWENGRSPHPGG
ncbi:AAA family ATPase [Actinopolymorpha sp. B11F2]|uniref:AAA family ATPase n=1 Tax=Actinopolymorpha sp. B11F2 TaxID=3160862 RepID=UPI0032E4CD4A